MPDSTNSTKTFSAMVMGAIFLLFVAMATKRHHQDPDTKQALAEKLLREMSELSSIPLGRSRDGPGLSFTLSLKKSCFIGDWDLIDAEMASTDLPKLLLTIEPLGVPEQPPLALRELPLETLRTGSEINLQIPEPDGLTSLGIFICKDSDAKGNCSGKPLASIDDLTRKYRMEILTNRRPPRVTGLLDKNYFFGFVVLNEDSVYFPNKSFREGSFQKLGRALSNLPSGSQSVSATVRQIHAANRALNSVRFEPHGRQLRLELPDYHRSACAKVSSFQSRQVETKKDES